MYIHVPVYVKYSIYDCANLLGFAGLLADVGTGGTFSLVLAPMLAAPGFLLELALDVWGGLPRGKQKEEAGWFSWFFGKVFTGG